MAQRKRGGPVLTVQKTDSTLLYLPRRAFAAAHPISCATYANDVRIHLRAVAGPVDGAVRDASDCQAEGVGGQTD